MWRRMVAAARKSAYEVNDGVDHTANAVVSWTHGDVKTTIGLWVIARPPSEEDKRTHTTKGSEYKIWGDVQRKNQSSGLGLTKLMSLNSERLAQVWKALEALEDIMEPYFETAGVNNCQLKLATPDGQYEGVI
jgi:hypothetical protein